MIIINFFRDLVLYIKYKFRESEFEIGFFCENKYIFNYLDPYIRKKINKKKLILIISFEEIINEFNDIVVIYTFKTNFFRELFFLTLKPKYLYSSTPDINNTIFKKTKFSNCKYIYIQHSPVSLNLIYRESAFDNFDISSALIKLRSADKLPSVLPL